MVAFSIFVYIAPPPLPPPREYACKRQFHTPLRGVGIEDTIYSPAEDETSLVSHARLKTMNAATERISRCLADG